METSSVNVKSCPWIVTKLVAALRLHKFGARASYLASSFSTRHSGCILTTTCNQHQPPSPNTHTHAKSNHQI